MEEARERLVERVQTLSDLELAVLVCLVAEQHCIIQTEGQLLDNVEEELKLVATDVFGLTWAVLECNKQTTLDDFGCGILVKDETDDYFNSKTEASNVKFASLSGSPKRPHRRISRTPSAFAQLDSGRIANIVVAKNLDRANSQVQIQALENDQFFISHKHYFGDGLPNIEEQHEKAQALQDDRSTSSVIHTPPFILAKRSPQPALFSAEDLATFTTRMANIKISSEVRATLAPLHNLDYISPSMVALAARKIYPHRIIITAPENERSMQWGSSLEAVKAVLDGVTADDVVEEVLQSVEVPL
ncbi:hypothetical protein BU25DRAFT_329629 [Macroventuria anomochaeta]|uniref:Uncharacterized protein n=1 Tax=Macroventuria anomochaeta TaxID=301207 RepID=A0ACB6SGJ5_9PLEO|nr:uncharacterized protein BU25DRAFT_329629 [Macroventuria anomochaeta]KAF2633103.1 hypothetical protein BU25DRAFT_329629 [Macroventuria anomochaeta]